MGFSKDVERLVVGLGLDRHCVCTHCVDDAAILDNALGTNKDHVDLSHDVPDGIVWNDRARNALGAQDLGSGKPHHGRRRLQNDALEANVVLSGVRQQGGDDSRV